MLDREQLAEYGINYDAGLKRFMGKDAMFERFLLKFLTDPSYESLKAAVESENCEEAFAQAHTLKGVAANLAMDDLYKPVYDATEAFRGGDFEAGKALFPQITEKYELVISFLKGLEA